MTIDMWPTPAEPTAEPPSRATAAQQAVFWDAVAAEAKERAAAYRARLDEQARAEFQREQVAPTWRVPGVGTIPLALTTDRVDVVDEAAYTEWVAEHYPTEVQAVHTVAVRPAFDRALRAAAVKRRAACDAEGRVIPGLEFVEGGQPKGISIRAAAPVKVAAAELARVVLDGMVEDRALASEVGTALALVDRLNPGEVAE